MAISVHGAAGGGNTTLRHAGYSEHLALPSALTLDVPPLPLCFVTSDAADAWVAVLGSHKRVKDLADKLRKVKIRSTWVSRKQMKIQEDAHVLTAYFSEPDLLHQLAKQLPLQQLDQFDPMSIVGSFIENLIGPEGIERQQSVLNSGNPSEVEAAICKRFPASRYAFSFGWSDLLYSPLMVLRDVLELIESERGERYFQACFAAYACMTVLIDTHVPLAQLSTSKKVGNALNGVLAHKLSIEKHHRAEGRLPLTSAHSLRGALMKQTRQLDADWSDPTDLLRVMASLHAMWGDGKAGFTIAAEEVANAYVLPRLKDFFSRLEKAESAAFQGERQSLGSLCVVDDFKLQEHTGPLVEAHVAVLSPLWSKVDFATYFKELETQVLVVEERTAEIVQRRASILSLSQKTHLDVQAISNEASLVSAATQDIERLIADAAHKLLGPFELLSSVMTGWTNLVEGSHLETKIPEGGNESQMLELALQEVSTLSAELQSLKRDTHHLRVKAAHLEADEGSPCSAIAQIPTAVMRKLINDPEQLTPTEILTFMSTLAQGRLRILPSAWRSAKESERFEFSARMLDLLDKLVFDYCDALRNGLPDSEARNILGSAYSAKESQSVGLVPAMRSERTFRVDGESLFFEKHIGIGNCSGSARGMRIYFEIIDGVVVIGYCGKHLTVVSTN
ncbi:hypothetical protein [Pseudomonas sp. RIT-PI-o]|uniref:hypothetical protein n=1 Tax=Pseudomonas sp. RIT-PI-o TaxID=1690246 RepID=UPI000AD1F607|nr:hypothetical protein [Pseudomonas sp. RIT-PI-o]